jgi:hypothetical protein
METKDLDPAYKKNVGRPRAELERAGVRLCGTTLQAMTLSEMEKGRTAFFPEAVYERMRPRKHKCFLASER